VKQINTLMRMSLITRQGSASCRKAATRSFGIFFRPSCDYNSNK